MFYCNSCGKKNRWPETIFKSLGKCGICGKGAICNDMKSSTLYRPQELDSLIGEEEMEVSGMTLTSREWAADTLKRVAEEGQIGMYPLGVDGVSAFDLGRALSRVCVNSQEPMEEFFRKLQQGWEHTDAQRHAIR